MGMIMEFILAVLLTGLALIFISVAAVAACATFYGIQSVIEEHKSKKDKKGKK